MYLQLAEACCIPRLKAPEMFFERREKAVFSSFAVVRIRLLQLVFFMKRLTCNPINGWRLGRTPAQTIALRQSVKNGLFVALR